MNLDFEERFQDELVALKKLFGKEKVDHDLPRLKQIHEYTEAKWFEYVNTIPGGIVRYLLIGEAPPWSPDGRPEYMLDPNSAPRSFLPPVCRAFFGDLVYKQWGLACTLSKLAQRGFLLMDSIPFSMKYTSAMRGRSEYHELVRLTTISYLQDKINTAPLDWSPDIRIAFGVKRNARAVLKAVTQLSLGGSQHPLSSQMIAVKKRGRSPNAGKLEILYGLVVNGPRNRKDLASCR